jgi:hypothetical protein
MNAIKKARTSVEKFAEKHKVGIAVAVTAVTTFVGCAAISRSAVAQREDFLKEKGLLDEFNAQFDED